MAQKSSQPWAPICLNILSLALLLSYCSSEDINRIHEFDARTCVVDVGNITSPKFNFTEILQPHGTNLTIPNIYDAETKSNRTLRISLCRGLSKKSIKCEGKDSSLVSACLYEPQTNDLQKLTNVTSNLLGNITKTRFYFDFSSKQQQPELYWLTKAKDNNCTKDQPMESPRVKISFGCLKEGETMQKLPTFIDHTDCTYNFKWAVSGKLCSWLEPVKEIKLIPGQDYNATSSTKIENKQDHEIIANITIVPAKEPHNEGLPKPTNDKSQTPKSAHLTTPDTSEPLVIEPKMNTWHKVFMTGLIIVSLVGFVIGLLILDRKTQLRIPLRNLGARGRFNPRSVPYNRMSDNMGSGLDL